MAMSDVDEGFEARSLSDRYWEQICHRFDHDHSDDPSEILDCALEVVSRIRAGDDPLKAILREGNT